MTKLTTETPAGAACAQRRRIAPNSAILAEKRTDLPGRPYRRENRGASATLNKRSAQRQPKDHRTHSRSIGLVQARQAGAARSRAARRPRAKNPVA